MPTRHDGSAAKNFITLIAAKLLPGDDPHGRIDAVDLKHVLGDIQTDCGGVHWCKKSLRLSA
jgi:hypothetical protein